MSRVPTVSVVAGWCFAGNAVLAGLTDCIVAVRGASLGLGGPAMIEGGGLGTVSAAEVGPADMHYQIGSVDVLVDSEAEATSIARKYLTYFTVPRMPQDAHAEAQKEKEQEELRTAMPANRRRTFDPRLVLRTLADAASVLELREPFGPALVTALARIKGRAVGVLATDPRFQSGAIGADEADKGARFMRLCSNYGLPLLFLCDCPGFLVGVDAERTGIVRHASRLFAAATSLRVPSMTVVLRRGYGLGAMGMAAGGFKTNNCTIAWPTAELGGMGLEGAVLLAHRRELEALATEEERQAFFDKRVALAYEHGRALNVAEQFEVDEVIDPAETREWVSVILVHSEQVPWSGTVGALDLW